MLLLLTTLSKVRVAVNHVYDAWGNDLMQPLPPVSTEDAFDGLAMLASVSLGPLLAILVLVLLWNLWKMFVDDKANLEKFLSK